MFQILYSVTLNLTIHFSYYGLHIFKIGKESSEEDPFLKIWGGVIRVKERSDII